MQFLPDSVQKMVNHLETESQIKVRVPTELEHNWEGVELAVSRKLTRTRELVNNNNNNNFISIALLSYVQGALQSCKQHY